MKFVLELKKTIVTEVECETAEGAVVMAMTDDDPDGLWAKAEPVITILQDFQPAPEYPLTEAEYAKKSGCVCPNCGSPDIQGDGTQVQTDTNCAWQSMECTSCKAMWDDQYLLTGYDNLTPFDPPKTDVKDLSAQELAEKYAGPNGAWGEHPDFCRNDWQTEVGNDDTLLGYWDWVVAQLDQQDARS